MALDSTTYSVWLSVVPWASDTVPSDDQFVYIGSDNEHSGTYNYSMAATGILGRPTSSAIVVDGSSGPTATFSFSANRVNPENPVDNDTTNYTNISNAYLRTVLRTMRQAIQMEQNAYMLRVYNVSPRLLDADVTHKATVTGDPLELPVFLNSYSVKYNPEKPSVVVVQLNLTLRNLKVGYAD